MSLIVPTYIGEPITRFPDPKLQSEDRPAFSASGATQGFISDFSWWARGLHRFPVIIDHALGMTSPLNASEGAFGIYNDFYKGKTAIRYENQGMLLEAAADGTACTLQMLFGFDYIGVRAVGIAAEMAPHLPIHASVLDVFSAIGNYLFSAMFFAFAAIGLIQATRASHVWAEYVSHGKDLSALIRCLLVPQEEISQLIARDKTTLHTLGCIALEELPLSALVLNGQYKGIHRSHQDTLLNDFLKTHFSTRPELLALKAYYFSRLSDAQAQALSFTEALGLVLQLEKLQTNREERAVRAFGNPCVQKIKRAAVRGLQPRLAYQASEVRQRAIDQNNGLLAEAEASYTRRQRQNIALTVLSLLGGIVGVLSCITLGPGIIATILPALDLFVAGGFVLLDATYLQDALNDSPGHYDKQKLLLYGLFISIGITLSILSLVYLGGTPLLWGATLGLSGTMLTIYAIALLILHKKEKRWKREHPTLDNLRARFLTDIAGGGENDPLSTEVLRCFKHLPKATRNALTEITTRTVVFHNADFRGWDAQGHFSTTLLHHYFAQDREFSEIEVARLRRAVKKTAKLFWSQCWHLNKNTHFQKQVLLLEKILECLTLDLNHRKQIAELQAIGDRQKHIELLEKERRCSIRKANRHFYAIRDFDIWTTLHENILRIFKREETTEGLLIAMNTLDQRLIQQIA